MLHPLPAPPNCTPLLYPPNAPRCCTPSFGTLIVIQKHWSENKWKMDERFVRLLNDPQVTCVGHSIKADLSRVVRTFFPAYHQEFKPNYVDVVELWKASDPRSHGKARSKTLAAMMQNLGWILSKNQRIRRGKWRSMNTMDKEQMEYCVVDALACVILLRRYSGRLHNPLCTTPAAQPLLHTTAAHTAHPYTSQQRWQVDLHCEEIQTSNQEKIQKKR